MQFKEKQQVSIISPCRNERPFIDHFISNVLSQCVEDGVEIELLIADGMSDDGTREVILEHAKEGLDVVLIDNPEKIVPTGLNAAIAAANGEIIIRMDIHTEYSNDYVQQCLNVLESTGADNVGGPWNATGKGYIQNAIALAFQSPFSSGGAGSHKVDYEGTVDSVYLGCWRKKTLLDVGGFDNELVRNQDDELNYRLVKSGKKLWQSPSIKSCYYPRNSISALYKQYSQYGYWKVRVMQKHGLPAAFRHIVPALFVATMIGLTVFSFFSAIFLYVLLAIFLVYALSSFIFSLQASGLKGIQYLPVMPIVFGAFHIGYGYGFLHGMLDFYLLKRSGGHRFSHITRN